MDTEIATLQGLAPVFESHSVRTPAPDSPSAKQVVAHVQSAPDVVILRSEEQVQPARDNLAQKRAQITRGGTRMRLDSATDQVVVQRLNQSDEVIRQLPPEEALRIAARFREITGLIFDQDV